MKKGRIAVDVAPGFFSTERSVSFDAGDRSYSLIVDEEDVRDKTLEVTVIAEDEKGERVMIDLPRDTFSSGSRVMVPRGILMSA